MKSITADELKDKIINNAPVNIVDVREDEEVQMGMIPDAKHIKMGEIPDNLNEFNEKDTYYIVCAGGVRSAKVVDYLNDKGIDAVNVEGGMKAYGDEGLEVKGV
ncbi:rhodanese-like domain-containing protein [Staphylococcus massiliensis]|uniref:Molybdopterin biosynthesis protein MoeB n=1 Tax=Staphylococcus massiliensis S46 TaxID=1229783 RepID=K9B924_9STAP|nr:rhodanese-like domain-containing protein [Staphylococcus massiliensis]EKU50270.1 molybdopterin biosynthesis protein MoeB [Staphylococcus massiliensis S46]MCG3399704.1 rhodanese-like domain-containing protein [Staphylococcus massiliensis]MCG3412027.1 rhodanese-like domain-containing protein [Staphylococcus massiliensis]PNZ99950.1 rhodanese-like domain-containing protein [Staphylococcus massiliensis CCUG 55927]